jgi:hypothetical protein
LEGALAESNGRNWVLPAASGQSAFAQTRTLRQAIALTESGHSFSLTIPVSASSKVNFGKEQLGTDFGKADASVASPRD